MFKAPSKADRRKARAEAKRRHGPKMFAAEELRKMIDGATDPALKAMLLLAANCGFGNSDCAQLYKAIGRYEFTIPHPALSPAIPLRGHGRGDS